MLVWFFFFLIISLFVHSTHHKHTIIGITEDCYSYSSRVNVSHLRSKGNYLIDRFNWPTWFETRQSNLLCHPNCLLFDNEPNFIQGKHIDVQHYYIWEVFFEDAVSWCWFTDKNNAPYMITMLDPVRKLNYCCTWLMFIPTRMTLMGVRRTEWWVFSQR